MIFIDFFSGIGGFRTGLEKSGHKCVGYIEIDKFAVRSYTKMYDTKGEFYANDIKKLQAKELPTADIWCGGFPCQDISVSNSKGKGLDGERSGLFFEFTRLIREKEKNKPRYIIVENVKNLFSKNRGLDFLRVLVELDEVGYDAEWQLINTSDYLPQNRERVYIIGHLRRGSTRKIFPIPRTDRNVIKQVIAGSQGYRVYEPSGISCTLTSGSGGIGAKTGLYMINIDRNLKSDKSEIMEVRAILTPNRLNKRQNGRRIKNEGEPSFTLTAKDRHGVYLKNKENIRIRRLTPKECFRLQGFSDEMFEKVRAVNFDNQLYKQAGNSVSVPIVEEIGKRL